MAASAALALGKSLLPVLKPYALQAAANVLGAQGQQRRANRRSRRRGTRRNGNGRINVPQSMSGAPTNVRNISTVAPSGSQPVKRRELLMDITTATALLYGKQVFRLNPLEPSSWPGLAAIASQYQRFKISEVSFEYCPKVGTTATGQVAVNVFPDAQALAPTTFAELASANGAKSGSVWTGITFSVPSQNLTQLSGQNGGVLSVPINPASPTDYDRFSTVGTCVVGWVGCAATTNIGTIYVHYSVTVLDPITKTFASTLAMTSADSVGQALGSIDFTGFASITTCMHPVARTATGLVRRVPGTPLFLYFHVTSVAANPVLTLTDSGTVIAPVVAHASADAYSAIYRLPAADGLIDVSCSALWTYGAFAAVSHYAFM